MFSNTSLASAATKRKADNISCDTSTDIAEHVTQRPRSVSTATTISTNFDNMTSLSPPSLRPTSSHSTKMFTDDDLEDERSPGRSMSVTLAHPTSANHAPKVTPSTDGIPKNFGRVMEGVYRSAFPQEDNLEFLKTLKLKTILYVPQNQTRRTS